MRCTVTFAGRYGINGHTFRAWIIDLSERPHRRDVYGQTAPPSILLRDALLAQGLSNVSVSATADKRLLSVSLKSGGRREIAHALHEIFPQAHIV